MCGGGGGGGRRGEVRGRGRGGTGGAQCFGLAFFFLPRREPVFYSHDYRGYNSIYLGSGFSFLI